MRHFCNSAASTLPTQVRNSRQFVYFQCLRRHPPPPSPAEARRPTGRPTSFSIFLSAVGDATPGSFSSSCNEAPCVIARALHVAAHRRFFFSFKLYRLSAAKARSSWVAFLFWNVDAALFTVSLMRGYRNFLPRTFLRIVREAERHEARLGSNG